MTEQLIFNDAADHLLISSQSIEANIPEPFEVSDAATKVNSKGVFVKLFRSN